MPRRIYCYLFFLHLASLSFLYAQSDETANEIISVTKLGIKNDGTAIGTELNDLVKNAHGKTLYFPAGTYNLSEAIVLPYDYSKNVNLIFDKNALIKSDLHLEALLKVGYYEMSTPDKSYRRFSYIEGGMFDCSNVDNGIIVNGLKQLVSLRSISLFKGHKTHIRINVTDDFAGTGSADTKIDNITIQGISSNQDVYGIYIDHSCADIKISNTFIYGTKYGIVTKSGGHILNNIHILSQVTTGGINLGSSNFQLTEGIRIENSGFFILNEIYFDTIDKAIVITSSDTPTLVIDKNIYFSYLKDFGSSFISRDNEATTSFQAKISNSILNISKKGYKVFDINPLIVGYDSREYFTFINNTIKNPHLLSPYDASLLQKLRKKSSDALVFTNQTAFDPEWHALGALIASPSHSLLRIDLFDDYAVELKLKFNGNAITLLDSKIIGSEKSHSFQIGYSIKDNHCVLFYKPKVESQVYPVISDLLGNGSFMTTPSPNKHFRLADYDLAGHPVLLIEK
ncbi:hypothetical protein [Parabacteroides sp. Marseille-P3160]|uniref:right-handed parallel beta-helix repeat-containing protein n=1 Tax=Parabacteroides sp. Marseille-P3160 TaxID=1917887 RepID=UPI0009BA64FB|nr:hypothetical protein [Parabacteroides sp. Marseille-P3160]